MWGCSVSLITEIFLLTTTTKKGKNALLIKTCIGMSEGTANCSRVAVWSPWLLVYPINFLQNQTVKTTCKFRKKYFIFFFFLLKVLDSDLGWRYLIRITYLNSSFYYIEHKYRYSASQVCQCKLLCPSGKIIKSLKYVCQKYWGINHHNRVVRTN